MVSNVFLLLLYFFNLSSGTLYVEFEKNVEDISRTKITYSSSKILTYNDILYVKNVPLTTINSDSLIVVKGYKNYLEFSSLIAYKVNSISLGGKIDLYKWNVMDFSIYPFLSYSGPSYLSYFCFDGYKYPVLGIFYNFSDEREIIFIGGEFIYNNEFAPIIFGRTGFYPILSVEYDINRYLKGVLEKGRNFWKAGVKIKYKDFLFTLSIKTGYPYWSLPLGMGYHFN